jgi:hypothetical protein
MIALAHLVWAPLGPEPLRAFVRSYRDHPAGAEHELIVVLNGLGSPGSLTHAQLQAELEGVEHTLLELERPMLDLAAYLEASRFARQETICFVNSYGVVLADRWLGHLGQALALPDVGLAGATGNWESQAEWRRGAPRHWPVQLLSRRAARRDYPRFPNPHVRTSTFAIDRRLLLGMQLPPVRDKRDAYLIESGYASLTRRVQRRALRAVVVDRTGRVYDPPEWPSSRTFRSGGQENLLVSDNQTRAFAMAPPALRRQLARDSWGRRPRRTANR